MKVFVAASYSSQVNYDTGEVFPEYRYWLEDILTTLESFGHTVFCALRDDNYKINDKNPGEAFQFDIKKIELADAIIALVNDKISAGVQTEIGYALGINKSVVLAHSPEVELGWFNDAIVQANQAKIVALPLTSDPLVQK